jgi:DNA ligase (NAD+)
LIDWGWLTNFWSVYNLNLHRTEWIKKPGFGVASVDKILKAIEDSRHTELWRLIAAAGIPEIGVTASKVLADYYGSWDKFRHAVFSGEDFSHLPDFGWVMNKNIHDYDFEDMDDVASHMIINAAAAPDTTQILDGKTFCITGKVHKWKNRDSLKEYIESLGGKVTGAVTSKTDYLINNDNTSTTAKNQSAIKLGKPILTEEEFSGLVDELLAK